MPKRYWRISIRGGRDWVKGSGFLLSSLSLNGGLSKMEKLVPSRAPAPCLINSMGPSHTSLYLCCHEPPFTDAPNQPSFASLPVNRILPPTSLNSSLSSIPHILTQIPHMKRTSHPLLRPSKPHHPTPPPKRMNYASIDLLYSCNAVAAVGRERYRHR